MTGYSAREAADLLDLTEGQIRSFIEAGLLCPKGSATLSFQDLVTLRSVRGLVRAKIAPRRVKQALRRVREQLAPALPLSGVKLGIQGRRVIVHDGDAAWDAESGQACFDFRVSESETIPHPVNDIDVVEVDPESDFGADEWYEVGCELENTQPLEARDAYRRVLELKPCHVDARVNLGRLLHHFGDLSAAEAHYRLALKLRPTHVTAAYNLAIALEDLGEADEAILAYQLAIALEPWHREAVYNLVRLYEKMGRSPLALRVLREFRERSKASPRHWPPEEETPR